MGCLELRNQGPEFRKQLYQILDLVPPLSDRSLSITLARRGRQRRSKGVPPLIYLYFCLQFASTVSQKVTMDDASCIISDWITMGKVLGLLLISAKRYNQPEIRIRHLFSCFDADLFNSGSKKLDIFTLSNPLVRFFKVT